MKLKEGMLLFHGSYTKVESIETFGRGFNSIN